MKHIIKLILKISVNYLYYYNNILEEKIRIGYQAYGLFN